MLSRRDFLKLGALSLGALALRPLGPWVKPNPPGEEPTFSLAARVAASAVSVYRQPDFASERLSWVKRDTILRLAEEIISPYGPRYNPRWYWLGEGYVHSGHLQRVEGAHLNEPLARVPEGGQLGEITVPFTQSFRQTRAFRPAPLYRLYYESVHWITAVEAGPDGEPLYGLTDELLNVTFWVPAAHMRPIAPEELAPISLEVPPEEKRIEISIPEQTLTAYEGERVVLHTTVSTGLPDHLSGSSDPDDLPTDTPVGTFHIEVKVPSKHMGDGELTSDPEAYELLGVPWVSFFHKIGVATHGTYWHDNFGRRMSHGCVNMRNAEARWVYRWSHPTAAHTDWRRMAHGTVVRVTE